MGSEIIEMISEMDEKGIEVFIPKDQDVTVPISVVSEISKQYRKGKNIEKLLTSAWIRNMNIKNMDKIDPEKIKNGEQDEIKIDIPSSLKWIMDYNRKILNNASKTMVKREEASKNKEAETIKAIIKSGGISKDRLDQIGTNLIKKTSEEKKLREKETKNDKNTKKSTKSKDDIKKGKKKSSKISLPTK